MKKIIASFLATFTLATAPTAQIAAQDHADWPEEITIVQVPDESNPNTPSLHTQFREHLAEELGIKVNEVTSGTSYAVGIEALASGQIDILLVSPQSYAQSSEKANAELFATNSSDSDYYTVFITQSDNDEINSLEDLEGKSFAFVDAASSSGYVYPKATLLMELGLENERIEQSGYFFENVVFSGGHDNSVVGVSMGDYDAAAVAAQIIAGLTEAGVIEEDSIKVIGRSVDIPNPSFVIRGDLPEDFKQAVQDAFLSFDNGEYFEALYGDAETRFVAIDETYYAPTLEILDLVNEGN
ncbi:phosphate/phosphite/phosphonate ABC transporter substrate-binding protein [Fundicoccus culcitae]|uniref:Phosphate/phosphite/phosphonate ABC transporter substrate-binding protein n=1 Tax=Fundicoccus culcitae TaxID=2969821 RepID=A0ABY5P2V0_9LACT|nr:phosphate/phosphite/phosphonate ABC transporter substrate-binding protein [Fundicoccus culcitae]UUX32745.1 phosphate/phosphite/phosphonate ABC transporter substrate-binding protein [Fundicoccus culcitae]